MAGGIPLRWDNGSKMPRATRIPAEDWNRYEPFIREMYTSMTLDELIPKMKSLHGFEATRRQYTHRLRGWGVQKQGTKEALQSIKPSSVNQLNFSEIEKNPTTNQDMAPDNLKRPKSLQSIGNRNSQCSTTTVSTNKRLKTTPEGDILKDETDFTTEERCSETASSMTSKESGSNILSVSSLELLGPNSRLKSPSKRSSRSQYGVPNYSRPYLSLPYSSGSNISNNPASQSGKLIHPQDVFNLESNLPQQISNFDLYLDGLQKDRPLLSTSSTSAIMTTFNQPISLDICLKVARRLGNFRHLSTRFELAGPIEDLLTLIADKLNALNFFEEASNIYAVLLVTEESRATSPEQLLTPRLIACARSAHSYEQYELVQFVLLKRLEGCEDQNVVPSERFLAHIFLTRTYARQGKRSMRDLHLRETWYYANQVEEHGDPMLNYPLNVLLYLYYKRLYLTLLSWSMVWLLPLGSTNYRAANLARKTAISQKGFIEFCTNARQAEKAEESQEPNIIPADHISKYVRECITWCNLTFQHTRLSQGSKRRMSQKISQEYDNWTEDNTLFEHLWQEWQEQKGPDWHFSSWKIHSRNELGISAAEHLRLCCELVNSTGLENLNSLADENLVDLYLQKIYDRTMILNEIRHNDVQSLIPQTQVLQGSDSILRSSLAPTITSSLRSSDLSLGRLKEAAISMKRRLANRNSVYVNGELPSGLGRESSSLYSFRISEISELSDRFERQLSIQEPGQENPSKGSELGID